MKKIRLIAIFVALLMLGALTNVYAEDKVIDIDTQQFEEHIKNDKNLLIIDLRTPEEFAERYVKNSINIDAQGSNFISELTALAEKNPEADWVVYCHLGKRSETALPFITPIATKKIYHLKGGILSLGEPDYIVVNTVSE